MDKILLDPVDFDALHLSVLAHGGIGHLSREVAGVPHCVVGHAGELEGAKYAEQYDCAFAKRLAAAGLTWAANDAALTAAGVEYDDRVDWETYVRLLNIDVKEG